MDTFIFLDPMGGEYSASGGENIRFPWLHEVAGNQTGSSKSSGKIKNEERFD